METCSLCARWQSAQGLFAFCPLQGEITKFRNGCVSWQIASEARDVCEYCGRPKRSPNYAYHLCSRIEKPIWMKSGAQGRILHLVFYTGLTQCGKQFNPQKTEAPKATSKAPTMPCCHSCMQAVLVQQTKGVQNA
jgi:hypothetical protein